MFLILLAAVVSVTMPTNICIDYSQLELLTYVFLKERVGLCFNNDFNASKGSI